MNILDQLTAEATALTAELHALVVTAASAAVDDALAEQRPVILIMPPTITYQTYNQGQLASDIHIIVPLENPSEALDLLLQLLGLLREPLDFATARPSGYTNRQGQLYPAYTATAQIDINL